MFHVEGFYLTRDRQWEEGSFENDVELEAIKMKKNILGAFSIKIKSKLATQALTENRMP